MSDRVIIQYRGYAAAVGFDGTSGMFHGEVLNLRDVITFQGASAAEVQQAFAASVEEYLAFCKARGEEPEGPSGLGA